jgi:ABC-type antimicrobial peptide transport system permease subunit
MTVALMSVATALRALQRNKLRSALTMLGIIIGVAAVIAMVSIGRGADAAVRQQIASLGNNLLMIVPGATTANGVRSGWGGVSTLTIGDALAIARECPSVLETSYLKRQLAQVVAGNLNWSTSIQGVTAGFASVRDWPVTQGRFFDARDEQGAAAVAVLGQTVVDSLFGPGQDPIGSTIRVKNVPFEVVGVLEQRGQTSYGQDQDDVVFVPFPTAERRVIGSEILGTVDVILAKAANAAVLADAETEIEALLRERHRILPGRDDDFSVRNLGDIAEVSRSTSRIMSLLLLGVASISLLVGGIGIMNIMLVSVTERTREIGIRMAVGARTRDILLQFLVESLAVSVVGGAIGVMLGAAATAAIANVAGWPTLLPVAAVVAAFGVAASVGIVFGFYPALRAAQLDPIVALRAE